MDLLMLQARRLPRSLVLSLGRHRSHGGALYLSNEKLAPEMVWTATPLEQRAQGLCEPIGVL